MNPFCLWSSYLGLASWGFCARVWLCRKQETMIQKHRKAALIWTIISVKKVGSVSAICSIEAGRGCIPWTAACYRTKNKPWSEKSTCVIFKYTFKFLVLLGCRIISFYYCIITEVFVTTVSCDMSEISTSNKTRLLHVRKRKVGPSINWKKLTNEGKKDFWIALIYIV